MKITTLNDKLAALLDEHLDENELFAKVLAVVTAHGLTNDRQSQVVWHRFVKMIKEEL